MKSDCTFVICYHLKDWRLLPSIKRDHEGWPKITIYRWLCFYLQVVKEPDYE